MKSRGVSLLILSVVLAFQAFQDPVSARPVCGFPPAACPHRWYARACATETYTALQWHQPISRTAGAGGREFAFLDAKGNVDLTVDVNVFSGDGAAAGILDLSKWADKHPDLAVQALGVMLSCGPLEGDTCKQELLPIFEQTPSEDYKAASVWYHGCKHKDSHTTKSLPNLQENAYVVYAAAEGGSSASIFVDVLHHSQGTIRETVCGEMQSGTMPIGTFTHKNVGHVSLTVQPQHGGTLSAPQIYVNSPIADGVFTVGSEGAIYFTGLSDPNLCTEPCEK
jgi:hypothetical protein